MWNKRNDEESGPRPQMRPAVPNPPPPQAQPPRPPSYTPPPTPPPAPRKAAASIGSSMHIKGEIRTNEELHVDGEVEGALESHSLLTVGPTGKVRANIKAREVVVYGSVRGNVEVSGKIAIRDEGSLIGDIKAAGISIDDGSYFKGSIDIIRPDQPKIVAQAEPKPAQKAGKEAEIKAQAS